MPRRIEYCQAQLFTFELAMTLPGVEYGGFVQRGKLLLSPRDDDASLSDESVSHEDELDLFWLLLLH